MYLTPLQRRILELGYRLKLSHLGSAITCADILDEIYSMRGPDEPVCLGEGHASLALYVVLEKHTGRDAEELARRHGVHSHRSLSDGIHVSGGSLGQVETVAMGMALARPERRVWLVSSDGGAAEGAFWETLRAKSALGVSNLMWYVNANGWSAYKAVDIWGLTKAIHAIDESVVVYDTSSTCAHIPFLKGLDAHYAVMKDEDWSWVRAQSTEVPF